MKFIWATRGRTWGFSFLSTAGLQDPLRAYEQAMSALGGVANGCVRIDDAVALKFGDPTQRQDRAGRLIRHAFVLYGELAQRVETVDDGLREVWPLVAARYAEVWEHPEAPSSRV